MAELLQVILSRGESEIAGVKLIEAALTSRLYLCIHRSELDLQNKLLHVLHSVVHAVTSSQKRHGSNPSIENHLQETTATEAQPSELTHDEMFVRVVSDAISTQRNNAVIHHWIDFLLMTIPQYRRSLRTVVFPLIDCLVIRLRALVVDFQRTYGPVLSVERPSEVTDAEYTVLMNALERLLLIAIAEALSSTVDEEPKPQERVVSEASSSGPGGLLGYMTGVLASAEMEPSDPGDDKRVSSVDSLCFILF